MDKLIIGIGLFLGSTIGSYVPMLWGGSSFSFASIVCSVLGGVAGVLLGYRVSKYLGFS